jgi:hypothetical protein
MVEKWSPFGRSKFGEEVEQDLLRLLVRDFGKVADLEQRMSGDR